MRGLKKPGSLLKSNVGAESRAGEPWNHPHEIASAVACATRLAMTSRGGNSRGAGGTVVPVARDCFSGCYRDALRNDVVEEDVCATCFAMTQGGNVGGNTPRHDVQGEVVLPHVLQRHPGVEICVTHVSGGRSFACLHTPALAFMHI